MRWRRIRFPPLWVLAATVALAGVGCEDLTSPLPAPGEIRGFIRLDGSPPSGIPVRIGEQQTFTRSDGSFWLTGVDTPYDLVIGHSSSEIVYEGVTRNDPIVTIPETRFGYSHRAILHIQVPAEPELQTLVFVAGAFPAAPWRYADPQTGKCSMDVFWDGADDFRYTQLHALRRRDWTNADLAVRSLRLSDGEQQTIELQARDFAPVRSFAVAGSVQMPTSTQSYVIRMSMSVSGSSIMLDASSGSGRTDSFAFSAPDIAGAVFDVDASIVRGGYSGYSYTQVTPISPQTGALALQLYNPPRLLDPPDEAVLGVSTASFSWDVGEGPGMYQFRLEGSRVRTLYTNRTHVSAANTPSLASALQPGHGYLWSVHKMHAGPTADELLTVENRGGLAHSSTTARKIICQ